MILGSPKLKFFENDSGRTLYLGYGKSRYFRIKHELDRRGNKPDNTIVDFNLFNFNGVFKAKKQVQYDRRRRKQYLY